MMRWVFIGLAVMISAAQPPNTGGPVHGPYADKDGGTWRCHQGETVEKAKRVHCECKQICTDNGDGTMSAKEDSTCMTYCGRPQCLCHIDSSECH